MSKNEFPFGPIIWGVLILGIVGCAVSSQTKSTVVKTLETVKDICPDVNKIEFGTNDKGEQIIESVTCHQGYRL
jgi:hypothetical protein